jgi:hypothetical protein
MLDKLVFIRSESLWEFNIANAIWTRVKKSFIELSPDSKFIYPQQLA